MSWLRPRCRSSWRPARTREPQPRKPLELRTRPLGPQRVSNRACASLPPYNGASARFLPGLSLGWAAAFLRRRLRPCLACAGCELALDVALQVLERVVDVVAHHRPGQLVAEPAE